MFKYILFVGLFSAQLAFSAPKLQNDDFATSAQITGAGGSVSQLLNSSKMYNSVDAEIMDTSIARWNAKLSSPVSLTTQVSGILPLANGGSNKNMTPVNGGVVWTDADSMEVIAAGSSGQLLQSNGAAAPSWVAATSGTVTSVAQTVPAFLSITGSPVTTSGTLAIGFSGTALPLANGGTNSTAAASAGSVVFSNATQYAFTAVGTSGQVLTSAGTGTPTWTTPTVGTVTSVAASVPAFLSIAGSPITSSGTLAITLSGTALPVANGGTGATTLSANGVVLGNGTGAVNVTSAGTAGQVLTSNGAGVDPTFQAAGGGSSTIDTADQLTNVGFKGTVASSALTIALTQKDMSTNPASGSGAVIIAVKTNSATGGYTAVSTTGALSTVISSGSTGGCTSAVACTQYVYLLSNGELAWSSSQMVDEGTLVSTTAEGGAGAADSKNVLYSTTARSNVGARLIGRLVSTQTTAGTWAAAPSETSVYPFVKSIKPSFCVVDSGNGHGSTNTFIRNFSNATSTGTGCTAANSATLGASITLNEDGAWVCSYSDFRGSSSTDGGISVNSNQLTTSILTITQYTGPGTNGRICNYTAPGSSLYGSCSMAFVGYVGDVVRAHDDTGMNATGAPSAIRCAKMGGN